jgi:polar amino acid transport system substrate-binding protein
MKTSIVKIVAILFVAVFILAACGPAAPAAEVEAPAGTVYRIASDATWPPFEMVDETSKDLVGFDIDLIAAVAEEAGFQYEVINISWDALLAGVSQCQYDGAISSISITDERKESMAFSDPYATAGQIITVGINETEIKGLDTLVGKRIGVQMGTTGDFAAQDVEGAQIISYDTVDLAFQDLMNGQVDAVIADLAPSANFVLLNADKIKLVGEQFTDEALGIAVCKTNPEFLALVNQGLAGIQANGKLDELKAKWFGAE